MKPHSIVCNRCLLVCVKFYLNRCRFTVVIAKCLGGSLFLGNSVYKVHRAVIFAIAQLSCAFLVLVKRSSGKSVSEVTRCMSSGT